MKITVPFDTLDSVAHVADIHIRLVKRHDEYRAVFAKFYEQVKKQIKGNSVIVVAGDIVHAKTDMSPEMVDLASEFLTSLADLAPTLVIAGNHDLNLSNMDRMDSLSPIIKNIGHAHLHYLKHSGIYQVADTDFAVFSILDEQEDWPSVSDCRKTARKVALFHGPVNGAKTDADFTITNRDVTVSTFNGFDIVMLGDIHKYQILQKKEKNRPIVVYSSSLIQQNHGETMDHHGWCLWDMKTCTHDFIEVPNDFGFYTVEMVGGQVVVPSDMPKNVRLRLFTGDADTPTVKKAVNTLKKRHNVIELSINKNKFAVGTAAKAKVTNVSNDVTNPTTQNTLIESWLTKNHKNLDEAMIKRVIDINELTNQEIVHDDQSRNISWKPLKFTFSNMFSYGEGNEIDFETMKGIHGIFAANASGKSSVVDALIYCLYDKTPRAYKGDHIMNNRKDKFECELKFDINGEIFFIRRLGTRKKSGDVKVEVSFWKELEDGTHVSLNGEERRQTNQNIRNYVGSYEDFVLTSLSSQSPTALFIDKSHAERKDLLIQFMGLNVFDKLHDAANEKFKEMTGVLKKYSGINLDEQLTKHQTEYNITLMEYQASNDNLNAQRDKVRVLYEELEQWQRKLQPLPNVESDEKKVLDTISQLESNVGSLTTKIDLQQDQLNARTLEIVELNRRLQAVDGDKLEKKVKELLDVKLASGVVEQELERAKKDLENIEGQVEGMKKLSFNPDCSVCVNNNQTHITQIKTLQDRLAYLATQISVKSEELVVYREKLVDYDTIQSKYKEFIQTKMDLDSTKLKAQQVQAELDKMVANRELAEKKLEHAKGQLDLFRQHEITIVHNQTVEKQIHATKLNIHTLQNDIRALEDTVKRLFSRSNALKDMVDRVTEEKKEVSDMEDQYDAYGYYLEATSRDGVPYDLMSSAVPAIEGEINNILTQMVDFTVTLEVDTKNIVGKLNYDHERIWPLENSSGMEKFLTSLAIRVALLNASNLPKSNFMIIDEGMGVLDADNLSSMGNLLNILKTQFDFLVIISHLEASRDMVEKVIEIKREDGYSYINV